MTGVGPEDGFNTKTTCELTGCTMHQLRYWDTIALVRPSVQETGGKPGIRRIYSFQDLVALRAVKRLLLAGLSLQRISRAFKFLRSRGETMLSRLVLERAGNSLLIVNGTHVPGARDFEDLLRRGQLVFFTALDVTTTEIPPERSGTFAPLRQEFIDTVEVAQKELAQVG